MDLDDSSVSIPGGLAGIRDRMAEMGHFTNEPLGPPPKRNDPAHHLDDTSIASSYASSAETETAQITRGRPRHPVRELTDARRQNSGSVKLSADFATQDGRVVPNDRIGGHVRVPSAQPHARAPSAEPGARRAESSNGRQRPTSALNGATQLQARPRRRSRSPTSPDRDDRWAETAQALAGMGSEVPSYASSRAGASPVLALPIAHERPLHPPSQP